MTYDNTNRGALFKNKEKSSENHPDYKGSLNAAGVDYFFDAWLKTSKAGEKYMSVSVKPKQAKPVQPKSREPGEDDSPFDDDLPF